MSKHFTREEYELLCRIADFGIETAKKQDKRERYKKTAARLASDFSWYSENDDTELELEGAVKKNLTEGISALQLAMRNDYEIMQSVYEIDQEKAAGYFRHTGSFDPEMLKALKKKLKREQTVPSRKMYISDLHFFHESLNYQMDNRGFADSREMNEYMIRQWNSKVTQKDEIYILGDLSVGKGKETSEILEKMHGKLYLIEGNHDKFLGDRSFDTARFEWIRSYAEIRDHKRKVVLSHYPVFCYVGQYRRINQVPDTYMLYGHVHDTLDEALVNRFIRITRNTKRMTKYSDKPEPIPCNMINCFCMYSDYMPLTLDEWIVLDEKRRERMNHSEGDWDEDQRSKPGELAGPGKMDESGPV